MLVELLNLKIRGRNKKVFWASWGGPVGTRKIPIVKFPDKFKNVTKIKSMIFNRLVVKKVQKIFWASCSPVGTRTNQIVEFPDNALM